MPLALITGASTGIGRATTLRLAAGGWTVLAGVRSSAAGEALTGEASSGRVHAIELDVTDPEQVAAAAQTVSESRSASVPGGLDALVNNAGIGVGGPLESCSIADLRMQLEVNVVGQIAVTQALLPALRRARGRIVLISSIGGRVAMPFNAPYAASKYALEAIGDALRGRAARARVSQCRSSSPDRSRHRSGGRTRRRRNADHPAGARGRVRPRDMRRSRGARRKPRAAESRPEQVAATIETALSSRRRRSPLPDRPDAAAMLLAKRSCPPTCSTGHPPLAGRRSRGYGGRRVDGEPREQAGGRGLGLEHARARILEGQRSPAPGEQIEALAVQRVRLAASRAFSAASVVERRVMIERVEREHPLQVDRVVLR